MNIGEPPIPLSAAAAVGLGVALAPANGGEVGELIPEIAEAAGLRSAPPLAAGAVAPSSPPPPPAPLPRESAGSILAASSSPFLPAIPCAKPATLWVACWANPCSSWPNFCGIWVAIPTPAPSRPVNIGGKDEAIPGIAPVPAGASGLAAGSPSPALRLSSRPAGSVSGSTSPAWVVPG